MKRILMGIIMMLMIQTSVQAETPTHESVTKLYVATFNRAPLQAGLDYWVNDSGLQLEDVGQSFFDQDETKEKYPADSTVEDFIIAVYANLFNREPAGAGLEYWGGEINSGNIDKSVFILAVMNGAKDTETSNDAMILANKTTVGLAFANAGLTDKQDAGVIMLGVTDDEETVAAALDSYGISATQLETLLSGNTLYVGVYGEMASLESWTFAADLTSSTWQEMVDPDGTLDNGSGTLVVDGMTMIYTCTYDSGVDCSNEDPVVMTVTEILEDYMLVSIGGEEADRLYYDEVKARAYYLGEDGSNTSDFETMIKGKTLYIVWFGKGDSSYDNVPVVEEATFNINGTIVVLGLVNHSLKASGYWEVTDNKLVAGNGDFNYDDGYQEYVSGDIISGCIQTNWINHNDPDDNNVDLFFTDKAVALNYAYNLTHTASCP